MIYFKKLVMSIIAEILLVTSLIIYGVRSDETQLVNVPSTDVELKPNAELQSYEELKPLKYPKDINLKEICKRFHLPFPGDLKINDDRNNKEIDVKSKSDRFHRIWSHLPKKSTFFGNKFEGACESKSLVVTPRGHKICQEKCEQGNVKYVKFVNREVQRLIKQAVSKEKLPKSEDHSNEVTEFSWKEIRVFLEPLSSPDIHKCNRRKIRSGFTCKCKPNFVVNVNSRFQEIFDSVIISGHGEENKKDELATRGLISAVLKIPIMLIDFILFLLWSIIHPIRALQYIGWWLTYRLPYHLGRVFSRRQRYYYQQNPAASPQYPGYYRPSGPRPAYYTARPNTVYYGG